MTPDTVQATPETPTCAELRRRADDLLTLYGAVMADATSGHPSPDQARRESLLTAAVRELRAQLAAAAISEAYVQEVEADAEARGFERGRGRVPRQRPGRHSAAPASRWQQGVLNVVRVLVPAAAAGTWAALRATARRAAGHPFIAAAAAHKAAAGAAVVAVSVGGAAVFTAAVIVPQAAHDPGFRAAPSVAAPAASDYADAPVASSPQGAPVTRARVDAHQAGQLPAGVPAPWFAPSSASASASPTPAPLAGTLTVSTAGADLSSGQPAVITLTASGAAVNWSAWCDPGADVDLSAAAGTTAPGVPSALTLSPAPEQDGAATATCHVWPGGIVIRVTLPLPAPPSPSASPSPAVTPSDTPSPSPA